MIFLSINPDSPTSRMAAFTLPVPPYRGVAVKIGDGNSFVWLDPSRSSPNLVLGVVSPKKGELHVLRPGDTAPIDPKDTHVLLNRLSAFQSNTGSACGWGLLGVGIRDEVIYYQPKRVVQPIWPYNVIGMGRQSDLAIAQGFGTDNLRGVRVSVRALDNTLGVLDPTPADFALTLTPYLFLPSIGNAGSLDNLLNTTPWTIASLPGLGGGLKPVPDGAEALTFTAITMMKELEVRVGAPIMGFQPSGLAGTGVVDAIVTIEGESRYS